MQMQMQCCLAGICRHTDSCQSLLQHSATPYDVHVNRQLIQGFAQATPDAQSQLLPGCDRLITWLHINSQLEALQVMLYQKLGLCADATV